jgi:hypothetical protein
VPRADHDPCRRLADEDAGWDGVLARVLEDDGRVAPFADRVPERLAELARLGEPLALAFQVLPVRWQKCIVRYGH